MIHGIVFDVELADAEARREPIAAHERGEAGVEAGARLSRNGQQLAIAPEIFRPALDLVARERDRGVVVDRLERPEALRAHVARFRRKRRLAQMTLQSDQRVHTASATGIWNEECGMWNAESRTGAGTTAALSRAIAAMSLRIATAVASPPAPMPKMPVSPECSPATIAAFCGPVARPKIDSRGTSIGATQAVSVDVARSKSACAIWRMAAPRARARATSAPSIDAVDCAGICDGSTRSPNASAHRIASFARASSPSRSADGSASA